MALSLRLGLGLGHLMSAAVAAFNTISAAGVAYMTTLVVQSSDNTSYTVPQTVLSADGTSYTTV